MSVLTLQFGQCGNQIGHHLFSLISQDLKHSNSYYSSECTERWFRIKPDDTCVARAVLVDTEQKVITEVNKKHSAAGSVWKYDETNIIAHSDGGTGNNWAYGHVKKGPELKEMIMESVRKEVEMCDTLRATLNLLSSAGGTGSGVGSYMVEAYRDEYPTKTLLNVVVLPYSAGEVIVQNYNTVLSIANLYDISDMFIIFQNDHLHKMCIDLLKIKNTELHDLNDLIAVKIGSLFQPFDKSESSRVDDIISHLTPHPEYKFITIKSAPHYPKETCKYEAPLEWNVLEKRRERRIRTRPLATCDSDSNQTTLSSFHEWPHDEKVRLLEALKTYGHYDLVNLQKAVPSKSRDQIKMAINMWWKAARTAMMASAGNKDNKNLLKPQGKRGKGRPRGPAKRDESDKAPIDKWLAKFEQAHLRQGFSQTKLLQKVFLYISKYENHPSPQDCNGVDYKAMYEYLYCMLNGFPGKSLNPETAKFVLKSLNDLAVEVEERGNQEELFFLDCVQRISNQVRQYGGKKQVEPASDLDTAEVCKNFLKTEGLNLLNVPMHLLKKK